MLRFSASAVGDSGIAVDTRAAEGALQPGDAAPLGFGEVHVAGRLTRADGDIVFQGRLTGAYHQACARCLEPAKASFSLDVLWTFVESGSVDAVSMAGEADLEGPFAADERTWSGDEVDLAGAVWEDLVLAAPGKVVCREDCQGLCPVCGVNRNHETCAHAGAAPESAPAGGNKFGKLAELFPDLMKHSSEE